MGTILKRIFFERHTPTVARDLLGKFLVRKIGKTTRAFLITEVEAYTGVSDMSSHARMGTTTRNRAMFEAPGHWYVYFIYGMYHCLNIVTETEGIAGAVLIRGVEGISGPGKLCKVLKIKLSHYGKPASRSSGLWIEDRGFRIADSSFAVRRTPRINVGGTSAAKKRLWRFLLYDKNRA